MSILTSLAIIAIALLIIVFMYFMPGVFALFYHYCHGKYSKTKTKRLANAFILGVFTISLCLLLLILSSTFIFNTYFSQTATNYFVWTATGLLLALAVSTVFFYFRQGDGTELFISRKTAAKYLVRIKTVKNTSDAFCLGIVSIIPELLFTLPLYIIVCYEITRINSTYPAGIFLLAPCIIAPTISLVILQTRFECGQNLANIQRSRVHNKLFARIVMSISYLVLAVLIISLRG